MRQQEKKEKINIEGIVEMKNYVVAIDVGSSEIKIAVGSIAESGAINIECIVTEPCDGVTAGLISNNQTAGNALRAAREKAEEQTGIAITDAYVSISGKFVRCARYTDHVYVEDKDNCIAREDMLNLSNRMHNVKAEDNENIMDLFPICYTNDAGAEIKNPVGSYSKQLTSTYNYILCERNAEERFRRIFRDAHISIQGMFASAAVISESVVTAEEKEEGVAIVDIGSEVTDLAIYRGGALCHMVSIPIGGLAINTDIHHYASQIPLPAIEKLKKVHGSAMASNTTNVTINIQKGARNLMPIQSLNLAAIIEARMTDIIDYVWNEIREAGFDKKLPAGIVLTGGVANLKDVAELFQKVTGVETRVACAELGLTTESLELATSPNLTLAVSLLLHGAKKGATPVGKIQRPAEVKPANDTEQTQEAKPVVTDNVTEPPVEKADDEKTDDIIDDDGDDEDIPSGNTSRCGGFWSRMKDKIRSSLDSAFQNPDGDDEDDNDDY